MPHTKTFISIMTKTVAWIFSKRKGSMRKIQLKCCSTTKTVKNHDNDCSLKFLKTQGKHENNTAWKMLYPKFFINIMTKTLAWECSTQKSYPIKKLLWLIANIFIFIYTYIYYLKSQLCSYSSYKPNTQKMTLLNTRPV